MNQRYRECKHMQTGCQIAKHNHLSPSLSRHFPPNQAFQGQLDLRLTSFQILWVLIHLLSICLQLILKSPSAPLSRVFCESHFPPFPATTLPTSIWKPPMSSLESQRQNASFFIEALCDLPNLGPALASQGS